VILSIDELLSKVEVPPDNETDAKLAMSDTIRAYRILKAMQVKLEDLESRVRILEKP